MALLRCKSLYKSFAPGRSAVDGVSLAVEEGEIVTLLGPSGCGKTTLLRMIAGLEHPDAGEVWFDGQDMGNVPPHEREFGMMFQDFALFPHKDVFDNIAFGLEMHHQARAAIEQRVAEMLQLVDLAGFARRQVDQLSGGEQQRVALARSLAPGPRLLMLDEPLGALDRQLRERLMLDLRSILKDVGVTTIYVTHDQLEAFAVSDRIAVMNQGKIEQIDTPELVYAHPVSPFVARFLGFQNVILATVTGVHEVETPLGELTLERTLPPTGATVTLLIRPDAVRVLAPGEDHAGLELVAEITALSFRGRYYQVWVQISDQRFLFELPHIEAQAGDAIRLSMKLSGIEVFSS
jgi:ABC-type Fe3+/spermidine/putrescine transport system ATPase subunit